LTVTVLLLAMFFTRRRGYSVFKSRHATYLPVPDEETLRSSASDELGDVAFCHRHRHQHRRCHHNHDGHGPKHRSLGTCLRFTTPNSSRFAQNVHSRILQKFPFLVEMFYWGLSFAAYRYTKILAQAVYGGQRGLWESAQQHGLSILELEARLLGSGGGVGEGKHVTGSLGLVPSRWIEWRIQRWFLHGAELGDCRGWILSLLNRGYALVHLPGTVSFLAYYYAAASSHTRFCTVRRTMTLTNFLAFAIFILVPTMPPRLLPKELGFVDSVSLEDAESVWMGGEFVNLLAAMPSMHFAYAFCIGCTFIVESGVLSGLFSWLVAMSIRPTRTRTGHEQEDGGDDEDDDDDDDQEEEEEEENDEDEDEDEEEEEKRGGEGAEESKELVEQRGGRRRPRRSVGARAAMFVFGVCYPTWMLITIVSTANHYFLDAFAAILVVVAGYTMNRVLCVFLPAEDYLLWMLRLEKPIPTTGWKKNLRVA
ncbi:hypothetical protein E4U53_003690, partial [Claviceps sorghi]